MSTNFDALFDALTKECQEEYAAKVQKAKSEPESVEWLKQRVIELEQTYVADQFKPDEFNPVEYIASLGLQIPSGPSLNIIFENYRRQLQSNAYNELLAYISMPAYSEDAYCLIPQLVETIRQAIQVENELILRDLCKRTVQWCIDMGYTLDNPDTISTLAQLMTVIQNGWLPTEEYKVMFHLWNIDDTLKDQRYTDAELLGYLNSDVADNIKKAVAFELYSRANSDRRVLDIIDEIKDEMPNPLEILTDK